MTKLKCNTETHKHCAACEQIKLRTEFYKNKKAYDGLQGYCKPCSVAKVRALHQANPKAHSDYNRAWDKRNPQKKRDNALKWRLGIPYGTYERMLSEQNGACAICKRTDPKGRGANVFHVDHDRDTKKVRGLLCHSCNLGIGHFFHCVEFLAEAINYLNRMSH